MNRTIEVIKMKNDWLFIEPEEQFEERDGKLYHQGGKLIVADVGKSVSQKGKILTMSKGVTDKNLKLGDKVLFRRRAGYKKLNIEGTFVLPLKPDQILAIMFGDEVVDVTPLKTNIFIEWEMAPEYYPGTNIRKPDAFRGMHYTGIIVHIGPDVEDLEVGGRVFFDQWCGIEKFEDKGKRYGFCREEDVYCDNVPKRKEAVA